MLQLIAPNLFWGIYIPDKRVRAIKPMDKMHPQNQAILNGLNTKNRKCGSI